MQIINKIVDYFLTRSIKNQVIKLLMTSGVSLVGQSVIGILFEEWIEQNYGIKLPNFIYVGTALMLLGFIVLYHDIKYTLLPSMFNTVKSSRSIYLGHGRYQFVFDKKMRCAPSICVVKPDHKENKASVEKMDEGGFIVKFEDGKRIEEIQFWADAWDGINFRQKTYLGILNIFRRSQNKLEKRHYENSFSQRKIDAINRA